MANKAPFVRDASGHTVVNTASPFWTYWLAPEEALAEGLHHALWLFFTKSPQNLLDLLKRTCDVAGCELAVGGNTPLIPAVDLKPMPLAGPQFWLGKDKPDSAMQLPEGTGEFVRVYIEPVDRYVTPNMLYTIMTNFEPSLTMLGVERIPSASADFNAVANEAALDLLDYTSDARPLRPVKYSDYLSSTSYYVVCASWERQAPTTVEVEARLRNVGLEFVPVPGAPAPTSTPSLSFVMGTGQQSPQVDVVRNAIGASRIYVDRTALDSSQAAMLKLVHDTEPIRQRIYDVGFDVADGTLSLVESAGGLPGAFGDITSGLSPVVRTVGYVALGAVGSYLLYRIYQMTWGTLQKPARKSAKKRGA